MWLHPTKIQRRLELRHFQMRTKLTVADDVACRPDDLTRLTAVRTARKRDTN
jgi:hypothetical protein